MATRAEKKAKTRSALMDSVLAIIGYGANFASISLREVAKTAGVVPTSFYRHFGDMEELGLAMVDELGLNLRRLMRGSFDTSQGLDEVIDHCIAAYYRYVLDNTNLFRFMNQARTGGSAVLQDTIRSEIQSVTGRIATELSQLVPGMRAGDRELVAGLVVTALLEDTTALLAIPRDHEALRKELMEGTTRRMRLIALGAEHWPGTESA